MSPVSARLRSPRVQPGRQPQCAAWGVQTGCAHSRSATQPPTYALLVAPGAPSKSARETVDGTGAVTARAVATGACSQVGSSPHTTCASTSDRQTSDWRELLRWRKLLAELSLPLPRLVPAPVPVTIQAHVVFLPAAPLVYAACVAGPLGIPQVIVAISHFNPVSGAACFASLWPLPSVSENPPQLDHFSMTCQQTTPIKASKRLDYNGGHVTLTERPGGPVAEPDEIETRSTAPLSTVRWAKDRARCPVNGRVW